jgi:hypothetical protein
MVAPMPCPGCTVLDRQPHRSGCPYAIVPGAAYLAGSPMPYTDPLVVEFSKARISDEAYVYVDVDGLTDYYCVFDLDHYYERDGPIRLRRQRWRLVEDIEYELPDPYESEQP